jgi:hypothetical protein
MTTKIVVRLLDADNELLGWAEHAAHARGDGKLWSQAPVTIMVERDGVPVCVSLHWADLNVESRIPCPSVRVSVGQTVTIFAAQVPMLTLGEPPKGLPAVTVGSVVVGVPTGGLGVVGLR